MRRIPPVYSPLSIGSLIRGWRATLSAGDSVALERLDGVLRQRFAADVAVLTDSGTSALSLAIRAALSPRPQAPVALPAYSCYDVATAAAGADAAVLLYDIDPRTLGPDWTSLQRAVAAGAGAVVVAPLFGLPVDFSQAASIAAASGATVIEDAAQGAGAWYRDRPLGSIGPLSVLSFGRGKGVTGGAGGALLARASGAPLLRAAALQLEREAGGARAMLGASAQWLLGRPLLYGLAAALPFLRLGQTIYREPHVPRRIAAGSATVVVDSLESVDREADTRRAWAHRLAQAARAAGLSAPTPVAGSKAGYLRFPLLLPDAVTHRGTRLGVARAYPLSLADLPELEARSRNRGDGFRGARELARALVTAPTHSRLSHGDVQRLERWIEASGSGQPT